jgi:NAD-dependent dihydropyrimidine dehydrogenase PreA subunit
LRRGLSGRLLLRGRDHARHSSRIDYGVCEPECPAEAIKPDTEPGLEK